ncbi:MAG: cytochrome c maturation protein CcmE [Actinomycetota bacterium]
MVAIAVVAGSLIWVATRGLSGNLVYFRTPTEVLEAGDEIVGDRIRLGGQVTPGTSRQTGEGFRFVVTDGTTRLTVLDTAGVPSLFRDGQGVVAEGFYGRDGVFHADTVLVKHGSEYRPPEPGQTPTSAELEEG